MKTNLNKTLTLTEQTIIRRLLTAQLFLRNHPDNRLAVMKSQELIGEAIKLLNKPIRRTVNK